MNIIRSTIVLCLLLVIVPSCTKVELMDPIKDPDPEEGSFSVENELLLDSIISDIYEQSSIPGIVVGVHSPKYGTYKQAFGYANLAKETPMKTDAIFGIGSVHKNFKWIALHLLAEEGVVDLGDLVNEYIEEPVLPGVTLRHLSQHSSGLCDIPDVQAFNEYVWNNPTHEFSYQEMIEYLKNASGQNSFGRFSNGKLDNFTPGIHSSYSSFGPLIAAEVMRKVTGKDVRELIDEKILSPLKLESTSHMAYESDPLLLTPGYADFTTLSPFTPDAASTMGLSSANGGAIHSSVSDLLSFIHNQFTNEDFLERESINNLTSSFLQAPGMKVGAGVIQFDQWRPSNFWGHAGFGIRSHTTTMLHSKEHELSIVVLTNIYTPRDDYQINYAISEAILNALY